MKVLFSTYPMAFQNPGGGEVIIDELYEELLNQGIEVKKFNPFQDNVSDYDIIHSFSTIDWNQWFYYHSFKGSFILTPTFWPRNNPFYKFSVKLKFLIKKIFLPQSAYYSLDHALTLPDCILPTTNLEKQRIQNLYALPESQFKILHNGVHIPQSVNDKDFKNKYKLNEYFLFVARISDVKNLSFLIDEFNERDETLVVIGDAKIGFEDYLTQCKKKARSNILFTGSLDKGALLDSAFAGASATIIPSHFETCSITALESLAVGTPVIITKYGGTTEIFKTNVTYFDYKMKGDFDRAMQVYQKDPEQLKKFIKQNYSWSTITKRLIQIYKDSLK